MHMKASITSPDRLENLHSFSFVFLGFFVFFHADFFSLRKLRHFLGNFSNLLVQSFPNFQSRVVYLFYKFNQLRYMMKPRGKKKELEKFGQEETAMVKSLLTPE